MRNILLPVFAFLTPLIFLQASNGDNIMLTFFLTVLLVTIGILMGLMIKGIKEKQWSAILALPSLVFSLISGFWIINTQSILNMKNGELLVQRLDAYRNRKGTYPVKLTQLENEGVRSLPKEWYLAYPKDYDYAAEKNGQSFSLYLRYGGKRTYVWSNGLDMWDFLD